MRDSSSLKILPYLCKKGAVVNYYDPSGEKKVFKKLKNCSYKRNIKANCSNADLVILLTEWDEFKAIDFKKIIKKKDFKVYDLRNIYNPEEKGKEKIKYFSIGRKFYLSSKLHQPRQQHLTVNCLNLLLL